MKCHTKPFVQRPLPRTAAREAVLMSCAIAKLVSNMLCYPPIPSTTLNLHGTHSLISIPTSWDAGTMHKIIPSIAFQHEFVHSGQG